MKNKILYVIIAALLGTVILQKFSASRSSESGVIRIDTVISYVNVHDTVPGKLITRIKTDLDTLWIDSIEYVPDTNYAVLLEQYKELGDKFFAKNVYNTIFNVKYGSAKVIDTIAGNKLVGNKLELDLEIPEKTITIVKPAPKVREIYLGTIATGDKSSFINGVSVGGLYKDKKDKIIGASIGYNGKIQYGAGLYYKIK
jgi:hypothetical protein